MQVANEAELLDQIRYPAFLVCDGIITAVNHLALQRQVSEGTEIASVLHHGQQSYAEFTQGCLCLTVRIADIIYNASVTKLDGKDLFCIESEYSDPELRALSVAAQFLRDPLSNTLLSVEALKGSVPEADLSTLNRNLHRLHRAICNMSDAAGYSNKRLSKIENCDISAEIAETVNKAKAHLERIHCTLRYEHQGSGFYCQVDKEKLERAVLNLISNAVRYGQKGDTVNVQLSHTKTRFCISVTNRIASEKAISGSMLFSYYQREPDLSNAQNGIGLGMTIARNAAAAHGGTLLFDQPEPGTIRFALCVPIEQSKQLSLHSHIIFPIDYCGGYDHLLTELSDILPDELFN